MFFYKKKKHKHKNKGGTRGNYPSKKEKKRFGLTQIEMENLITTIKAKPKILIIGD